MTLKQIEYIIKVAEAGSINKAANQLFISQSVISTSIKNLEDELGRPIFVRTPRGVQLTPFGRAFITYAKPIGQQFHLLDGFLYQSGSSSASSLSVVSNGFFFLYPILNEIYRKHADEGLVLNLCDASSLDVLDMVSHHLYDIGLMCVYDYTLRSFLLQARSRKVTFHPLAELRLAVEVGPHNPLFHQKYNWVTPKMLAPYPAVMYGYMNAGPFSELSRRIGIKSGKSRITADSRAALYEATNYSDAYYLSSDYSPCPVLTKFAEKNYITRRNLLIKDCPIINYLGWVSRTDELLNNLQQELVDQFNELLVIPDAPYPVLPE